jgi:hypothetical protein
LLSTAGHERNVEWDTETKPLEIANFLKKSDDVGVEVDVKSKFVAFLGDVQDVSRNFKATCFSVRNPFVENL